jgi:hypothetical protein
MLSTENILVIIQIIIYTGMLIWTVVQIHQTANQIKYNREWNQKNATYEYFKDFEPMLNCLSEDFKDQIDVLTFMNNDLNSERVREMCKNTNHRNNFYTLLSYYERLCTGICSGYFNEEITKEVYGQSLPATFRAIKPYIDMRREETKANIGTHFEIIATKWINETQNSN